MGLMLLFSLVCEEAGQQIGIIGGRKVECLDLRELITDLQALRFGRSG